MKDAAYHDKFIADFNRLIDHLEQVEPEGDTDKLCQILCNEDELIASGFRAEAIERIYDVLFQCEDNDYLGCFCQCGYGFLRNFADPLEDEITTEDEENHPFSDFRDYMTVSDYAVPSVKQAAYWSDCELIHKRQAADSFWF